jgi:hypothetical protein
MRTTLNIADDVLSAAKELARRQRRTAGDVLSELARQGLSARRATSDDGDEEAGFLGFRPFPSRGAVVTDAMVSKIREDEGV